MDAARLGHEYPAQILSHVLSISLAIFLPYFPPYSFPLFFLLFSSLSLFFRGPGVVGWRGNKGTML
ncbi:hypothetical protein L228DRAFT_57803 [Xylona heveae TC161]|uniref:Uncharacterized protein n=1 Tax=Xylona heveae (strain CBS 132557 / TC161) TaxID=1328760 RepID=A0A165IH05_XYLHT|nr:hypothetical protein L228DRAFT_57803 [Xylona heveae TC161]KZF24883.1 hypothetical protein L228DRAFT_57803 [Xylona heveae TC161]